MNIPPPPLPLLLNDAFEQVKQCRITFIAFFSCPTFFAPTSAFSCIARTLRSTFAICAARHVAILTVLSYNTFCKNVMIQLCAVSFL